MELPIRYKNNEIKQSANQQLVKETNLTLIFNLINKLGAVSRAELAQITRLSPTTVSSLTEELINAGIILEKGSKTMASSGRRPIILEVKPDGGFVASVEIADYGFNLSLYDLNCSQVATEKYLLKDFTELGHEITDSLEKTLLKSDIDFNKFMGICIGVPGIIDSDSNRIVSSTVVPIKKDNAFYDIISSKFKKIPILLGNESSFSAYAEKEFGSDNSVSNLVYMDINIGIGAGIIIDNEIFTGSTGLAGEVGHISIDLNGPKCKCGNRGCLEVMASIPAMTQRIIFGLMSGQNTVIAGIVSNDFNKINIGVIREALDREDSLVIEIADETAKRLAFGINNIINTINPETVIIGGEITELGDVFLNKIKKWIKEIGFGSYTEKIPIRYSNIEGNAVTLGAARYMLDNIFKIKWIKGELK